MLKEGLDREVDGRVGRKDEGIWGRISKNKDMSTKTYGNSLL